MSIKQTVYVASPESHQIHVWHLDTRGSLILLQSVYTLGQVQPMVVSPDRRFLYVGVRPRFRILTYQISPEDGTLIWIAESELPGSPTYISIDHKGQYLFSSSYNYGCISVTRLENGIPKEVIDIVEGLEGCHSVNISPYDGTIWVPALKQDRIYLFVFSNEKKLTAQTPSEIITSIGTAPRHMVFHPNQQYAYVINELCSSIDVWQLKNTNRRIICVQTIDIMPNNFSKTRWASDIHITPNGLHLYACDRTTSLITILSVSKDGSTLTIEGFKSTETQPRGFNIDYSGKYLVVAGQKSDHISLYEIKDERGLLKERGRYSVGRGPMWVVFNIC